MRIVMCLVLVACGGSKEPHGNVDRLRVTRDGKPVAVDRAYMRSPSRDVYAFVVGTKPASCTSQDGGVFGFTVTKRVSPRGEERWAVTDVYGRETPIQITNPGAVALDGPHVGNLDLVDGTRFSATGELTAVACPVVEPSGIGVPKSAHASNAKISVAGKSLPVRGVILRARQGVAATDLPNIWISTQVRDCSQVELPAQVQLSRIDGKWSLRGTWIENPVDPVDAPELDFSANMVGKSADGPTLDLQLSGAATVGDYPVQLVGVAQAIECTN